MSGNDTFIVYLFFICMRKPLHSPSCPSTLLSLSLLPALLLLFAFFHALKFSSNFMLLLIVLFIIIPSHIFRSSLFGFFMLLLSSSISFLSLISFSFILFIIISLLLPSTRIFSFQFSCFILLLLLLLFSVSYSLLCLHIATYSNLWL